MTELSPGAQAVASFEIDDVFLISSVCFVDRKFNPSEPIDEGLYAHRVNVSENVLLQTRTPIESALSPIYLVRYFVVGEVCFLRKEIEAKGELTEIPEKDMYARICLTYAADYRCTKEQHERQDCIGAFSKNVVFNVWSYWREGVHDMTARMRLPRVTIPMLKPKPRDTDYQITAAAKQ